MSSTKPIMLATAPLRGPGLDVLAELGELIVDPWIEQRPLRIYSSDQLASRAASEGATILIVEADSCKGRVLELPLTAIASCRGEPTNVDVKGATTARIPVLRAPGRNADAVAELVVGLLISSTRFVIPADRDVRSGQIYRDGTIPYQRFRGWQLAGRKAGLVGLGAVGRALRWRLEGLGMEVISYDPYAEDATSSLEELISESDVISMHAAVTPETAGMISHAQFRAMKDGVVFLNAARAELHDTDALVEALQSGKVSAAGLDHFHGESLPADHPLSSMDNVVLTPHIGGATYDTETNHTTMIAEGLKCLLAGKVPANLVNPEVLR